MLILVDTREQLPFAFQDFPGIETARVALPVGDYSLPGFEDRVAIERKGLDDLVACLKNPNRDRFERELNRAKSYELFAVVIEANVDDVRKCRYRSAMKPASVMQSVFAFQVRYRIPFMFAGSRANAQEITHSLLSKYAREITMRFEQLSAECTGKSKILSLDRQENHTA